MKNIYLTISIILLIVDRSIKYFASSINFGGGFVKMGIYKNYSGAFSLPIAGWLYNIAGIILLIIFIYLFLLSLRAERSNLARDGIATPLSASRNNRISYLFIIFGGASNLFDRIYFGYVIDYIQVSQRSFFNIADAMIIEGILILVIFNKKFMSFQNPKSQAPSSDIN